MLGRYGTGELLMRYTLGEADNVERGALPSCDPGRGPRGLTFRARDVSLPARSRCQRGRAL